MERSAVAATAAVEEEQRLEHERTTAREKGDWHAEIEASAELLGFYQQNALVLGIDETSSKVEQLTAALLTLIDSVLASDQAPEDPDEREDLERTKLAVNVA